MVLKNVLTILQSLSATIQYIWQHSIKNIPMSNLTMDNVIIAIYNGSDMVNGTDPDMYKTLISQHFKT